MYSPYCIYFKCSKFKQMFRILRVSLYILSLYFVWLVYIFRIFFRLVVFHYGYVTLLFFKERCQNDCDQILKRWIHAQIRKGGKVCLKSYLEKIDIKLQRISIRRSGLMRKGSIFSDWSEEQFPFISQIRDLVEVK